MLDAEIAFLRTAIAPMKQLTCSAETDVKSYKSILIRTFRKMLQYRLKCFTGIIQPKL
jgi:hypothetical protein